MRLLLRELGSEYDVHGFRTTFKSFCLDNLKHVLDEPAVELAHDHAIGGKVAETYRDTSLIGHRRILNERWVAFLTRRGLHRPLRGAVSLVVDNVRRRSTHGKRQIGIAAEWAPFLLFGTGGLTTRWT